MKKTFSNIYVSMSSEDDYFIDMLRERKMKEDKRHYTKTDIVKYLIGIGIDAEHGLYLRLDPNIDQFVSKLQEMVIEMNNEKITIKKSKEQVYHMLIEKGIQNLDR